MRARALISLILVALVVLVGCEKKEPEPVRRTTAKEKSRSSSEDRSPKTLHSVAIAGNIQQIEQLLAEGADIDMADESGASPLHLAVSHNQREATELLLAKGANVDTTDGYLQTPLHLAARYGYGDLLESLLAHRAKLDVRNDAGATPLYIAASQGYMAVVRRLISRGADVNAATNTGKTALFAAIDKKHTDIADLLREHGAVSESVAHRSYSAGRSTTWLDEGPPPCPSDPVAKRLSKSLHNVETSLGLAMIAVNPIPKSTGPDPLVGFLKKSTESYPPTPAEYEELKRDISKMRNDTQQELAALKQKQAFLVSFNEPGSRLEIGKKALERYLSNQSEANWTAVWNELVVLAKDMEELTDSQAWRRNVPQDVSDKVLLSFRAMEKDLRSMLPARKVFPDARIAVKSDHSSPYDGSSVGSKNGSPWRNVTTVQAAKGFIKRAYELEKSSKQMLDLSPGLEKSVEDDKKLMECLGRWTSLWADMATYYSGFKPNSEGEVYGECLTKILVSLMEGEIVSGFLGARWKSVEHYELARSLLSLRKDLLNMSNTIKVRQSEPRHLESFHCHEPQSRFASSHEMLDSFGDLRSRFYDLTKNSKSPTETVDGELRRLVNELDYTRVRAGTLPQDMGQAQEYVMLLPAMTLRIIDALAIYTNYKAPDPQLVAFHLKTTHIELQSLKANQRLLKNMLDYFERKRKEKQ